MPLCLVTGKARITEKISQEGPGAFGECCTQAGYVLCKQSSSLRGTLHLARGQTKTPPRVASWMFRDRIWIANVSVRRERTRLGALGRNLLGSRCAFQLWGQQGSPCAHTHTQNTRVHTRACTHTFWRPTGPGTADPPRTHGTARRRRHLCLWAQQAWTDPLPGGLHSRRTSCGQGPRPPW